VGQRGAAPSVRSNTVERVVRDQPAIDEQRRAARVSELERLEQVGDRHRGAHRVDDALLAGNQVVARVVLGQAQQLTACHVRGHDRELPPVLGPGIRSRVVVDAEVVEGANVPLLELGRQPLHEVAALGIAVLDQNGDRGPDQRHAVDRALVEKSRVIETGDQLVQLRATRARGQQRPHDRARRRARDALELVPLLEHRHHACMPDAQHPAA